MHLPQSVPALHHYVKHFSEFICHRLTLPIFLLPSNDIADEGQVSAHFKHLLQKSSTDESKSRLSVFKGAFVVTTANRTLGPN